MSAEEIELAKEIASGFFMVATIAIIFYFASKMKG